MTAFLSRKFLFSKQSDGFFSLIAFASVFGVALGVAALIVVLSVVNGFEGELARAITSMNGDVIFYTRGSPMSPQAGVEEKLKSVLPSGSLFTRSFVAEIMVSSREGVAGAILEGVELSTLPSVLRVQEKVSAGKFPENDSELILGKGLAERLGVKPGDPIRLVSPFSGPESVPTSKEFKVSGIFSMGMHTYDSKYLLGTLSGVQSFLSQPHSATTWKIKLPHGTDALPAARHLQEEFGVPFRAKAWPELNRNLFYAVKIEKIVILILLGSILMVAALNVVSTLMVFIHDRRREIMILKAMGIRSRQNFRLFGWIGFWIGIFGGGLGVLLGLGLSWFVSSTQWIEIPADIYMIGFLPVKHHGVEIAVVAGSALLLSLCATLYPALRAERLSISEGIRDDAS